MVSGMTPAGECNFWVTSSISSELELHQVGMVTGEETTRRHGARCWEFADSHGDLVAGVAPGTVDAVLQDFIA